MITPAITEYGEALEAHRNALKSEFDARVLVHTTRTRLLVAKDELRADERAKFSEFENNEKNTNKTP